VFLILLELFLYLVEMFMILLRSYFQWTFLGAHRAITLVWLVNCPCNYCPGAVSISIVMPFM
jgi:hypothetical protein